MSIAHLCILQSSSLLPLIPLLIIPRKTTTRIWKAIITTIGSPIWGFIVTLAKAVIVFRMSSLSSAVPDDYDYQHQPEGAEGCA